MMPALSLRAHSIEPLESRIAPALLVNGANLLGAGGPSTGETSVGENSVQLVKVYSGQAIVWFDGSSITSISVGPGVRMDITGDVTGDIVANLTAAGALTDSDADPTNGEDGGILLANDILGIKFRPLSNEKGSVNNIITGGSVSNIDVSGSLSGVYAGDGVFRAESALNAGGTVVSSITSGAVFPVDINPFAPGIQDSFVLHFSDAAFKAGASINGVKVALANNLQVFAGNGSPTGAPAAGSASAGGSISNVQIELASVLANSPVNTPSYHLIAGNGGAGKVGGAGGSIFSVLEINSSGPVILQAGHGGAGNGGGGGAGGNVLNLDVQSASSQYNVQAGDGGAGTPGGAGGRISNGNFSNRTPLAGVLITADFDGDGFNDVMVADSGTGLMVLNKNNGPGSAFVPVDQNGGDATIAGVGVNPVDGLASDVDNDGDMDAVILYRDGTVAAYLNDGGGVFYDAGESAFSTVSSSVGFTPAKFTEIIPGSGLFTVAENTEGKGILHGLLFQVQTGDLITEVFAEPIEYNRPIADVAGSFVGLTNGNIEQVQVAFSQTGSSIFSVQQFGPDITGGLDDLDLSADRSQLLALSTVGKSLVVYDVSTPTATAQPVVNLSSVTGKAIQAKFIDDNDPLTADDIVVLSNTATNAQLTLLDAPVTQVPALPYTFASDFTSDSLLKNIAPLYEQGSPAATIVGVAGPLNQFTEVTGFASEAQFALPFASKQVSLTSGDGGLGIDLGTKLGKGGAGGAIINTNVDAQIILMATGAGGNSNNGAAGAGGSIYNTPSAVPGVAASFKTYGGATVVPEWVAIASIEVVVGNGGSPLGAGGPSASGGAGGSMQVLTIRLQAGDVLLSAGSGGVGKGGAGGAGGALDRLSIFGERGGLTAFGGAGGAAMGATGNGGAGGAITNLRYTLDLDEVGESFEDAYNVTLVAGNGGISNGATGGAGGSLTGVTLKLDTADTTFDDPTANPPLVDTHRDSTLAVTVVAGEGGDGVKGGGVGGSVNGLKADVIHDQLVRDSFARFGFAVLGIFAGDGGEATAGNGGAGGAVTFSRPVSGFTQFDPDSSASAGDPALLVVAGDGGNGSLAGGAGGSLSGLTAQNSAFRDTNPVSNTMLSSAVLIGGNGGAGGSGNGGVGGSITNALVGVFRGYLDASAGNGGASTNAKGGAGGSVAGSEFGLVYSFFPLGMSVAGGGGGAGKTAGGAGGNLSGLKLNTPQSTENLSAYLIAGDGGAATGNGAIGGKGGDILNISQAKDYNSSINLVEAGNGGASGAGKGGAGGNVLNFRTIGFIGRPSNDSGDRLGVFDDVNPQGIFSGRGGDGLTDGINGSITSVSARQIAAMAAAVSGGTFAAASKISNVTAAVVGFDADNDGVFDTTGAAGATPSGTVPIDGFILASAISKVTGTRPAFTFLA